MKLPPQRPFAPSRFPLFYGWVILITGTLGIFVTVPAQTMGVSPFTDFLIRDLRITRSNLSLAYLIGTLTSSFILSRAGRVYDAHGARLVGTISVVLLGLVLLLLSVLPEIVGFITRRLPEVADLPVAFALMTVGFFLLRFSGQGVLSLVSRNMVLKWFDRRRGLANALVGVATTLGFASAAIGFNTMIEGFGWQNTWRITGFVLALPFALLFVLFSRDNPAECGLEPDGGIAPRHAPHSSETRSGADFTLVQAQRTLTFWVILGTATLGSMYFTGLTFNIVSLFEEAGHTRAQAIATFFPASLIALAINLIAGWVSDHIRMKYLVMVQIVGILTASIAAIFLSAPAMVLLLIISKGINGGVFGIVAAVPWPRYYGLLHLGRISGFVMGWAVAGSALGPYFFSLSLDLFGSYRVVSVIVAAITLALLALSPFANRPSAPRRVRITG